MEHSEPTEPTDPMLNTEPVDPIDNIDPVDPRLHREPSPMLLITRSPSTVQPTILILPTTPIPDHVGAELPAAVTTLFAHWSLGSRPDLKREAPCPCHHRQATGTQLRTICHHRPGHPRDHRHRSNHLPICQHHPHPLSHRQNPPLHLPQLVRQLMHPSPPSSLLPTYPRQHPQVLRPLRCRRRSRCHLPWLSAPTPRPAIPPICHHHIARRYQALPRHTTRKWSKNWTRRPSPIAIN